MLHALLNMLLGMGSVFVVLVIICLIIYCFKIFPYLDSKFKAKESLSATNNVDTSADVPAQEISVEEDMGAIVAAITAAITAYTGMSSDEFVVRSIVRKK